ncbi:MAG: BamA/TamA family outer membrane protein [Candidatus Neomarinimicrobiota bacterium]
MAVRLWVLMLVAGGLWAQVGEPTIARVVVEGNGMTKRHIIVREMALGAGQRFDAALAHEDRNRLYNLGIFEWVDIRSRRDSSGETELVVEVVETWRILPFPLIGHLDDLGPFYGGGISYLNFRGLNQRLDLSATFGALRTYTLAFADPWILGNRIAVTGWVQQVFRRQPVRPLVTQVRDLEFSLGKSNLPRTLSLRGSASLEQRTVDWQESGRQDTVHRVFQGKIDVLWRTTDIWRDPTRGWQLNLYLSPVLGLDQESPTYMYLRLGGAWFHALGGVRRPLVAGAGVSLSYFDRATPIYMSQYVGSQWVRGYHVDPAENSNEIEGTQEATSVARASVELRKTLIPRRLVQSLELGLSGVLFADIGWGYGPGEPLAQARPLVGYGAGLRLFIPIINVVALDAGTNPYDWKPRLRLRLSQAF